MRRGFFEPKKKENAGIAYPSIPQGACAKRIRRIEFQVAGHVIQTTSQYSPESPSAQKYRIATVKNIQEYAREYAPISNRRYRRRRPSGRWQTASPSQHPDIMSWQGKQYTLHCSSTDRLTISQPMLIPGTIPQTLQRHSRIYQC